MFAHAGRYGSDDFVTPDGVPVPAGTDVAIYEVDGSTLATIYGDKDRSAAPNPFTLAAPGNVTFHAEPGEYLVSIRGAQVPVVVSPWPQDVEDMLTPVDPDLFAKLEGGNQFVGRQELLLDLPTFTTDDIENGAEFIVISCVKDDAGQIRSADVAAKIDLSNFGLAVQTMVVRVTFVVNPTTGINTGQVMAESIQGFRDDGAVTGVRVIRALVPDLRVGNLFAESGTLALLMTGTPVGPTDAANKEYVDALVGAIDLSAYATTPYVDGLVDAVQQNIPLVDVRDHGAVLDGVTDDWPAVMSAIGEATTTGKGIFIPEGELCVHRSVVVPPIRVIASGMDRTIITRPPSVGSSIVSEVGFGDDQVELADASPFSVGMPIHLWDSANFEGDDTHKIITAIDGNLVTFDPPSVGQYSPSLEGRASSSFALLRPQPGSEGGLLMDFTVNQKVNEFDPKGVFGSGDVRVEFAIAAIHLNNVRHWHTNRVKFINCIGDAYGDQGRAHEHGPNYNELAWCVFVSPYRHAIHLGTSNDGSYVHHNVVSGVRNGYCMFFCAEVTNCTIEQNYFFDSTAGLCGIDERDSWNIISNNHFVNCSISISATGTTSEPFGLVVEGNSFYNDTDTPTVVAVNLGLPSVLFVNNRLHNTPLTVAGNKVKVDGNLFTLSADAYPLGLENSASIYGDDVEFCNNNFDNSVNAVLAVGANRLRADNIVISNSIQNDWVFGYEDSIECVVNGRFSVAYVSDGPLIGSATRLLHNGIGDNGSSDPSLAGDWNAISGAKWNGTTVKWLDGVNTKISIFVHGAGWIQLGSS